MKSKLLKFFIVSFIALWLSVIYLSCEPYYEPPSKSSSTSKMKMEEKPPLKNPNEGMMENADRQDTIPTVHEHVEPPEIEHDQLEPPVIQNEGDGHHN